MNKKEFSTTKQFCSSIFEQHWTHLRHLESERMWIMGIWLGLTGLVFKEIWMGKDAPGLQALRSISAAHLILTLGVLSITLKLQLEHSKHIWSIREMTKESAPMYKRRLEGVWQTIWPKEEKEKKAASKTERLLGNPRDHLVIPILTLGGVVAAILIGGILTDLTLLTYSTPDNRFVCGFPQLGIFFGFWVFVFWVYQRLFNFLEKKLKRAIS